MSKMTVEQKKWQAEEDAYTLARAEEIKQSKARLNAALNQANKMAKEQQKRANNLKKVAKKNTTRSKK